MRLTNREADMHELLHQIIRTQAVHSKMLAAILDKIGDSQKIAALTAELNADAQQIDKIVAANPVPVTHFPV